jgi:hypothetical protein
MQIDRSFFVPPAEDVVDIFRVRAEIGSKLVPQSGECWLREHWDIIKYV